MEIIERKLDGEKLKMIPRISKHKTRVSPEAIVAKNVFVESLFSIYFIIGELSVQHDGCKFYFVFEDIRSY